MRETKDASGLRHAPSGKQKMHPDYAMRHPGNAAHFPDVWLSPHKKDMNMCHCV